VTATSLKKLLVDIALTKSFKVFTFSVFVKPGLEGMFTVAILNFALAVFKSVYNF
jgi:hypothetical protein